MSDEVNLDYSGAGAETGQSSDAAQDSQPTYVTPDELESRLNAVLEQAKRFAQSKTDQASDRISKALKQQEAALLGRVNALKAAGYDVADSIVEEQRQQIVKRVLAGESEGDDEQPAQDAPPLDRRMQARILSAQARVANAIAESGIDIEAKDPELSSVRTSDPDPNKWADSYLAAIRAKAKRMGKTLPEPEGNTAPAAARMPGGFGGGGTPPATLEANTKKLDELYRDPVKNQKEILKLLAENDKLLRK